MGTEEWLIPVLEKPENFDDAEWRYDFRIFSHFVFKDNVPMWIGYNSKKGDNIKQKVVDIRNYDEKSTNPSMGLKTLRITGKIASEYK